MPKSERPLASFAAVIVLVVAATVAAVRGDLVGPAQAQGARGSAEEMLRQRAWVEDNRRKVDELSGGRLAYVYLPNTGQPGYTYFNRMYFAQQDRQGAVIDERNNGGGSAADYIVDVMARELTYFAARAKDRDHV